MRLRQARSARRYLAEAKYVRIFRFPGGLRPVVFRTAVELRLSEKMHCLPPDELEILWKRRISGRLALLVAYLRERERTMPLDALLAAVSQTAFPNGGRLELKPVEAMPDWVRAAYKEMLHDYAQARGA
jgi:hypothetical protein